MDGPRGPSAERSVVEATTIGESEVSGADDHPPVHSVSGCKAAFAASAEKVRWKANSWAELKNEVKALLETRAMVVIGEEQRD
ncbi:hypothetical protein C1H46_011130 [Malus baccata]|uniref:Uncharacterized protein n=1 Tax=Malus baccata TaxID=106549 RepID=A0A540MWU1_MALBA|nr:hypothetical protein C1H46_011130 [Malus baccata]